MGRIGVIGGSGIYQIEGVLEKEWVKVETPFGEPSDQFLLATYQDKEIVFLPRHGRGHKLSPSQINYRANIFGMKYLQVERIISLSACGSLREEIKPLDFVIPTQFVDRSWGRKHTFFEEGVVVHIGFSQPVCLELAEVIYKVAMRVGVNVHWGSTYLNIEGPQFSTLAESNLYRSWGMDIIGMTNMIEARLAKEAEICYATLAAVTDYDCWYKSEEVVTAEMVLSNLKKNADNAKKILKEVLLEIPTQRNCPCKDALKDAIVTSGEVIPLSVKEKLKIILGKYIA